MGAVLSSSSRAGDDDVGVQQPSGAVPSGRARSPFDVSTLSDGRFWGVALPLLGVVSGPVERPHLHGAPALISASSIFSRAMTSWNVGGVAKNIPAVTILS